MRKIWQLRIETLEAAGSIFALDLEPNLDPEHRLLSGVAAAMHGTPQPSTRRNRQDSGFEFELYTCILSTVDQVCRQAKADSPWLGEEELRWLICIATCWWWAAA
ncbi:MAG: hypothetical protein QF926_13065 [Alphaproteobacteria bacterium]|jgi:hypothetical protein|nr:hypothetical protein [Alphaproteobacteria bacterium]